MIAHHLSKDSYHDSLMIAVGSNLDSYDSYETHHLSKYSYHGQDTHIMIAIFVGTAPTEPDSSGSESKWRERNGAYPAVVRPVHGAGRALA